MINKKGCDNLEYKELVKRFNLLIIKRRLLLQKGTSDVGLYWGQLPILKYIAHHNNCSQIDIARSLELSPASVAISTKRLEKAGMLTKVADETDLRCKKLAITEQGREKAEACHKSSESLVKKCLPILVNPN